MLLKHLNIQSDSIEEVFFRRSEMTSDMICGSFAGRRGGENPLGRSPTDEGRQPALTRRVVRWLQLY